MYKLGLYIHVIKSSEEVFSNHQFDFVLQMEDYQRLFTRLDPRFLLGPDWDIYLMTFLALLLGFIVLLRRVRWHRHYLQEWTIVFLFSLSNLVINEKHIIILYNLYIKQVKDPSHKNQEYLHFSIKMGLYRNKVEEWRIDFLKVLKIFSLFQHSVG